jgi:HK97 family phage major capsid protein
MKKLAEILAKMKLVHGEMSALLNKGKTAEDEAQRARFKVLYEAKSEEYNNLKAEADEVRELDRIQAEIDSLEADAKPDLRGKSLTGGRAGAHTAPQTSAEGNEGGGVDVLDNPRAKTIFEVDSSPERQEYLHRSIFLTFAKTGPARMDGEAIEAFKCKDQRLAGKDGEESDLHIRLPRSMAKNILSQGANARVGIDHMRAKVVLSTDATGGSTDSGTANLIAPDFRPQLLRKAVWYPDLYDLVRLIPAVNGTAEWPMLDQTSGKRHGGVAFTWKTTEGADKGSTEPVFKDFTISTAELSGWTEVSRRALRRPALDLEALLTELFRSAVRYEFSRVILEGTGAGSPMAQPLGILNAAVTKVTRETANMVDWIDLVNLEFALGQAQRANGRYVLHETVEKFLKQTVDSDKRPLFTADVQSNIKNLLAGYGYTAHDHNTNTTPLTLGVEGDIIFGDWNDYGWAMEEDIMIARSDHAAFKQDRVVFRLTVFVGGKPIYLDSFVMLDNAVTP